VKIRKVGVIALGLSPLCGLIAWNLLSEPPTPADVATAVLAAPAVASVAPAPSEPPATPEPPKQMALGEWMEKRASGNPGVSSTPPHIQTVLSSFGLPEEMWESYASEPVETLEKRLGDLKAEFAALQQETAKLKEEHSELARGSDPKQADTFMRDEVLPIFDERNRLLGEALLVVNAKALASNAAPDMPSEMRVR
jgi:hypothetical protein